MKTMTVALPLDVVEYNYKPEELREYLRKVVLTYEHTIRGVKPIELYTDRTYRVTLRVDERTIEKIKEYARELNISILMFTSCIANMYNKSFK